MSEKVISIFGLIFVTAYVAKYVGPGVFGQISFSMSVFQITQIIAQLGSSVIIFKRISKKKNSGVILINATVFIRIIFYMFFSLPVVFYFLFYDFNNSFWFVFAAFLACFFSSLDVYSIYYDATLKSKTNAMVNMFGLIVSLTLRWLIVRMEMDPIYITIPMVLTSLIPYVMRAFSYRENFKVTPFLNRHRRKYRRYLLYAGGSFVISDVSIAIYTRLSLLLLAVFATKEHVGVYSVAISLAGSWSFIAMSFITSTLPSIFSEKDDLVAENKTAKLTIYMILVCIPIIVSVYILGRWFLSYFYGYEYEKAFYPLMILCLSTVASTLGTISARFIARYSGYAFLSKKMLVVLISSVLLNLIFIPHFDIVGAAFATLITEILSLTLFNYFFKKRVVAKLHIRTLMYPFLYIKSKFVSG